MLLIPHLICTFASISLLTPTIKAQMVRWYLRGSKVQYNNVIEAIRNTAR